MHRKCFNGPIKMRIPQRTNQRMLNLWLRAANKKRIKTQKNQSQRLRMMTQQGGNFFTRLWCFSLNAQNSRKSDVRSLKSYHLTFGRNERDSGATNEHGNRCWWCARQSYATAKGRVFTEKVNKYSNAAKVQYKSVLTWIATRVYSVQTARFQM